MGCFGASCGLSNVGINEGDEVGFTFLMPYGFRNYLGLPDAGITQETSSTANFKPFLPPIYGEYDDYGSIENIQRTPTVDLLEKLFGRDIDVIMECVTQDRSIYSPYGGIEPNYSVNRVKNGCRPEENYLNVGFTLDEEKDGVFTFDFNGRKLIFDSKNSRGEVGIKPSSDGKLVGTHTFSTFSGIEDSLDLFGEVTGVYPGFEKKDYWAIKNLHKMSGMFFRRDVFDAFRGVPLNTHIFKRSMERSMEGWEEFLTAYKETKDKEFLMRPDRFSRTLGQLYDIHPQFDMNILAAYEEDGSDLIDGLGLFLCMSSANRMFAPTFLGEQYADDEATRELLNISLQILDKRKAQRNEEME